MFSISCHPNVLLQVLLVRCPELLFNGTFYYSCQVPIQRHRFSLPINLWDQSANRDRKMSLVGGLKVMSQQRLWIVKGMPNSSQKVSAYQEANVCLLGDYRLFAQSESMWKRLVHKDTTYAEQQMLFWSSTEHGHCGQIALSYCKLQSRPEAPGNSGRKGVGRRMTVKGCCIKSRFYTTSML